MTDNSLHTIEPAYHPKSKMGFLVDWLLTLKCNYDCTYCPVGPIGHDNSTEHPPLDKCLQMLQQMYRYVDVIMGYKKNAFRDAILNVYGGEALYHPEIEKILTAATKEYEKYSSRWRIRRRLTTNATATEKKWKTVCEHLEGITFSYHSQGPDKMKTLFKNNIEYAIKIKKEYDIVICMYPHKDFWQDCLDFLNFCQTNNLNARPKLLDGWTGVYNTEQLEQLKPYIKNFDSKDIAIINKDKLLTNQFRGCCGGRPMCTNRNTKDYTTLLPRTISDGYKGWHCSANQFFLHGNNLTGKYFTNKDCRVRLNGQAGHFATIDTIDAYIDDLQKTAQIQNSLPTLKCVQSRCNCGTCAPKSIHKENLIEILKIYNTV